MTRGAARRKAFVRALRKAPLAITCLLLISLFLLPTAARAQTPGVTVSNVPPVLQFVDVGTQDGLHRIEVVVTDDNSWGDILRVDMEILDESGAPVAHVVLQAYLSNASATWDPTFIENLGQNLVQDQSMATVNMNPQTILDRSELQVTFTILPLVGRWLRITATDLNGLNATAQLDYLTGFIGGPTIFPPWLLLLLAVAASVILVGTRIRREIHGG